MTSRFRRTLSPLLLLFGLLATPATASNPPLVGFAPAPITVTTATTQVTLYTAGVFQVVLAQNSNRKGYSIFIQPDLLKADGTPAGANLYFGGGANCASAFLSSEHRVVPGKPLESGGTAVEGDQICMAPDVDGMRVTIEEKN